MSPSAITFKNPSSLFDPTRFGFSHVSITEPSTRIVHLAGQVPIGPKGAIPESFEEQVHSTFNAVKTCLAEAGAGIENIVNLTVYVVDYATNKNVMELIPANLALEGGEGSHRPPTAVIPVPVLAVPGVKIEVTAVAAVPI